MSQVYSAEHDWVSSCSLHHILQAALHAAATTMPAELLLQISSKVHRLQRMGSSSAWVCLCQHLALQAMGHVLRTPS
jgi:hypothetical protein